MQICCKILNITQSPVNSIKRKNEVHKYLNFEYNIIILPTYI